MIIPFEEFERAVMHKILEKESSINKVLREQYKKAQVIDREFTGVGFFTRFKMPEDAPVVIEPVEYGYGNVLASINDSAFDFGFVLFIKNGIMTCLEGYTWADAWPQEIHNYILCYSNEEPDLIKEHQ